MLPVAGRQGCPLPLWFPGSALGAADAQTLLAEVPRPRDCPFRSAQAFDSLPLGAPNPQALPAGCKTEEEARGDRRWRSGTGLARSGGGGGAEG